jgi:hypothetical protein
MKGFQTAIEKFNPRTTIHVDLFQEWFATQRPFKQRNEEYYWGPEILKTWKKRVFAGIQADGTPILVHVFDSHAVSHAYACDEIASIPTLTSFETGYITEWMEYNLEDYVPIHPREKLRAIVNYVKWELRTLPHDRYLDLSPHNIWCDFQDILFFCDFGSITYDNKSTHPDLQLPNPDHGLMALYSIGRIFKHCDTMANFSTQLCQADPNARVFNRNVEETLEFLLDALSN